MTTGRRDRGGWVRGVAIALGMALGAGAAGADHDDDEDRQRPGRFCSATAGAQYRACLHEVRDDFHTARAICINASDGDEREECFGDAREEADEALARCRGQRGARRDLCGTLGEARYDPAFDPEDYQDPRAPTVQNPYLPLAVGNRWAHSGGGETVDVEVLDEVKLVDGVTCVVVNDVVREEGELIEDTDDWFALRKDAGVDYCGESVRDFESFGGDDPELPELVSIDGSFKAGRDGDKAGTLLPGAPVAGQVYRQEWSAGNAEDAAEVLSVHYGYGDDPELDAGVPQALAELLCDGDCLVTRDFTPLEPDTQERKYYAPGIGRFLEVNLVSGEIVQLVDCNVDPRCGALPAP